MICGITNPRHNITKPEYLCSGFFYLNMSQVDYIIVGGGYAGYFFAHQLISANKSFVLFSDQKSSASEVSAGIINPVVLKRFTTFWLAAEQISFLEKTLSEIEKYSGKNFLVRENIRRIFHDESERDLWLKKARAPELQPFLDTEMSMIDDVENPFGAGSVHHSARLEVAAFFRNFKNYLELHQHLHQETFYYDELKPDTYRDISFKNIVFCEGMGVRQNPYFKDIPVLPNKGHHLKVKLSKPSGHAYTIKKKHFLFPVSAGLHYYGGTYDRFEADNRVDEAAVTQLTNGLSEFYKQDFEIAEINYGWRPTVKDRRPILGRHPENHNFYVFNGLGARGILNGCYFSKALFEFIENGVPLMPEVDLKRFETKNS